MSPTRRLGSDPNGDAELPSPAKHRPRRSALVTIGPGVLAKSLLKSAFLRTLLRFALLLLGFHLPLSARAQSLPDEQVIKEQAANQPVDQVLKIPADVCTMRLTIEYPSMYLVYGKGAPYTPTPHEISFCEYAATLLAGASGPVSELKFWKVPAHSVPVVGFPVEISVLLREGQAACTFKNSGGRLVYA